MRTYSRWRLNHVLVGGRWLERQSVPFDFSGPSISFCGELILLGCGKREGDTWSPCYRALDLEANTWHTLEWKLPDKYILARCATDDMAVAITRARHENRARLRSLRPGSDEGWVPIPDTPVNICNSAFGTPSLCCVEGVLYVASTEETKATA